MDPQSQMAFAFYGSLLFLMLVVWRDKIERNGLMFLKRTDEGVAAIDAFGTKHADLIKVVGYFSVRISLLIMVLASAALIHGVWTIFNAPTTTPPATVGIVVPGIRVPGAPFYIPLFEGLIAIITVMVIHEFSHGIFAAAHGVKPKTLWLFLLIVIPGAGVELDETKIMRKSLRARMDIYAAGSFANVVTAVTAALFINFVLVPAFQAMTMSVGIEVLDTSAGLPAALAGIPNGTVITSVNGVDVANFDTFTTALAEVKPNETVNLATDRGPFSVMTTVHPDNPEHGYLGVIVDPRGKREVRPEWAGSIGDVARLIIEKSVGLFTYIFILHLSIGLINLLPVFPLDGGRILVDIAEDYGGGGKTMLAKLLSSFLLVVFILNLIGPQAVTWTARLLAY